MDLDRQEVTRRDASRPEPPQRLPEAKPPVFGDWFIYLSVIVLFCGIIAITALNFGATLRDPIVKLTGAIAAGLLAPLSADAAIRSWRAAWVWLPVDKPRAYSRFIWTLVLVASFVASIGVVVFLLTS